MKKAIKYAIQHDAERAEDKMLVKTDLNNGPSNDSSLIEKLNKQTCEINAQLQKMKNEMEKSKSSSYHKNPYNQSAYQKPESNFRKQNRHNNNNNNHNNMRNDRNQVYQGKRSFYTFKRCHLCKQTGHLKYTCPRAQNIRTVNGPGMEARVTTEPIGSHIQNNQNQNVSQINKKTLLAIFV